MKEITIHRPSGKGEDWFVHSRLLAQDKRLKLEDIGLLTYLLSRPPNWQVRTKELQDRFGVGDHKLRQILNRCKQHGYIRRTRIRNKEGRYISSRIEVYAQPHRDYPHVDEPHVENRGTYKIESIQNREVNKTERQTDRQDDRKEGRSVGLSRDSLVDLYGLENVIRAEAIADDTPNIRSRLPWIAKVLSNWRDEGSLKEDDAAGYDYSGFPEGVILG